MQEQTQNDKMVPIDTSGEGVEVQLETKEDQVSQPDVQVEETQTAPVQEGKEEELEEYSQSVKRRIDKLTKKMREAERRESAAIEYAKNVNEKLKRSETLGVQKDERSIKEGDARIKTQEEFTKRAMEAAIQAQDVEKQVAAQQQLAKLELERERLRASERRLEREKTEPKEEINVDQYLQQQAPQQQQQPSATPEAEDWAEQNKYNQNKRGFSSFCYPVIISFGQ
jgi:hypothetical protein